MILLRYFQNKHINAKHTQPLFQSNLSLSLFLVHSILPPWLLLENNDPSCNNSNNAPISLNWPMHRFAYIDLPSFPPLDLHWIVSKPIPLDSNYEIPPLIQCVTVPCADYDPRRLRKCHGREIKVSFHGDASFITVLFYYNFSCRFLSYSCLIHRNSSRLNFMYIDNFHGLKIKEYYTYNNDNKLEKKSRRISDRDLRQGNIIKYILFHRFLYIKLI